MPIQIFSIRIFNVDRDALTCSLTVRWYLMDSPEIINEDTQTDFGLDTIPDYFALSFWPDGATFT